MCFSQVLGYTVGLFEAAGFLFWGCGCRSRLGSLEKRTKDLIRGFMML